METFTYDNLNRLTSANWNDTVTPDVTTTYDAANRVTQIKNSNSTIDRIYFNDGLLHVETNTYADGIGRSVNYNYDPDGRRSTVYYPGYTAGYTYTGRGQLDLLSVNSVQVANYNYDLNGNLTGRTLNNSTSSTYGYDPLNRCTGISHALVGTTRTFSYGYDTVGNRDWVKRDGNLGDAYDYDKNDQVTATKLNIANPDITGAAGGQTIVYDANGNRTSFSPPYTAAETYGPANALNQYTTRNGSSAAYDGNGNMTRGFDGSTYTYDAQNRLLSATKGGTTDTFLYDGLNRQIGKKVGSGALFYRLYDGWDLLGEYKTGTTAAYWAYLYGASGLVKNLVSNNYYYQDASGSTSHVAGSTGALKEWYRYDLQGKPIFYNASGTQLSDTAIGVRHLFTGQQWYNELGLYDLRNRYYSPDIGRFLQSDPASFGGDAANLYRYCGNNPVTRSDPTGLTLYWAGPYPLEFDQPYTPTGTNIPLREGSDLTSAINFPEGFSSSNGWGGSSGAAIGGSSGGAGGGGLGSGYSPPVRRAVGLDGRYSDGSLPFQSTPVGQLLGSVADVIGKIWALPDTIFGLAVGIVSLPFGGGFFDPGNNAIQISTPWFKGAVTFGNVILYGSHYEGTPIQPSGDYTTRYNDRLGPLTIEYGLHENAHTLQYQIFGPFYAPFWIFGGGPSAGNPLENAADNHADGSGSWWPGG